MNENDIKQKIREDFRAYVLEQVHPDDLAETDAGRIAWLQGRFLDDFSMNYLSHGEKTSAAQNDYSDAEREFLSENPAWANIVVATVREENEVPIP